MRTAARALRTVSLALTCSIALATQTASVVEPPKRKLPTGAGLYARVGLSGAMASCLTHTLVTPLDVIKTHMQIQPELGVGGAARRAITTSSGRLRLGGLFHGARATAIGYWLQGAAKFGGYELGKRTGARWTQNRDEWRLPVMLGSAAMAEVFACCLLCPLELLKLRIQTDPKFLSLGLSGSLVHVLRHEGVGTLFQGFGPVVLRQLPYTTCKLVCYELAATALTAAAVERRRQHASETAVAALMPAVVLTAGLCAGAAAAVVSQPGDVLLTRLCGSTLRPDDVGCKVALGLVDQLRLLGDLGCRECFRGLKPRVAMVSAITSMQFFLYDTMRTRLGAGSSFAAKQ